MSSEGVQGLALEMAVRENMSLPSLRRDQRMGFLNRAQENDITAEMIRDQALYVAGLLVEQQGGPSVKPYQPGGLWREVSIGGSSNTQVFARDDGEFVSWAS